MKTKSKRLLSLALAVVMAVSASMACFSAYAYKPSYGEQATERQFTAMIGDLDQLLDENLLTADTIYSLYEALPSLSTALYKGATSVNSATGEYYLNDGDYKASTGGSSSGGTDVTEREYYTVSASGDGMYSDWYFGSITGSLQLAKDGSLDLYIYYYTTIISEGITFNHIYANGVEITETSEYSSGVMQGVQFTIYGADYDDDVVITVDYTINGEAEAEPEPEPEPDDGEEETASIALSVSYNDGGTGLAEPAISTTTFTGDDVVYLVFTPGDTSYNDYTIKVTVEFWSMTMTVTEGTLADLDVSGYPSWGYGMYQIPITGSGVTGTDYISNMIGTYDSVTVYVEISAPSTNALSSVALLSETEEDVDTAEEDTAVDEDAEDVTEDVAEDTETVDEEFDIVAFFTENNLLDYCDESGNITDTTFEEFFADHPLTVESAEDFATQLNEIIDNYIVVDGLTNLLALIAMAYTSDDVTADQITAVTDGLDNICKALGIEQEASAVEVLGWESPWASDLDGIRTYLKNIVNAIFGDGDTVNNIIDMLQVALTDDNFSLLYASITDILANINGILEAMLGSLVDLSSVTDVINEIYDILVALPKVDGNENLIDVNALIPYILTMDSIAETIGNYVTVNEDGSIHVNAYSIVDLTLTLPEIDLKHITEAESNADVLKAVVDYVYKVFNTNYDQLNEFLGTYGNVLTNVLTSDLVGLSADVADLLVSFLTTFVYGSDDDAAWWVITLVAGFTERDVNAIDEDLEPDSGSGSTDSGSGSTSGTSTGTTASGTSTGTSDSADDDTTTSTVTSTSIPDTGRVDEGVATAALIVFVCAAAALVVVLAKTRKKVSE